MIFSRPDPDPDTSVLKIFNLFYDGFEDDYEEVFALFHFTVKSDNFFSNK